MRAVPSPAASTSRTSTQATPSAASATRATTTTDVRLPLLKEIGSPTLASLVPGIHPPVGAAATPGVAGPGASGRVVRGCADRQSGCGGVYAGDAGDPKAACDAPPAPEGSRVGHAIRTTEPVASPVISTSST